jgi:hypothetical protein
MINDLIYCESEDGKLAREIEAELNTEFHEKVKYIKHYFDELKAKINHKKRRKTNRAGYDDHG